jgi:hypothetical protein
LSRIIALHAVNRYLIPFLFAAVLSNSEFLFIEEPGWLSLWKLKREAPSNRRQVDGASYLTGSRFFNDRAEALLLADRIGGNAITPSDTPDSIGV